MQSSASQANSVAPSVVSTRGSSTGSLATAASTEAQVRLDEQHLRLELKQFSACLATLSPLAQHVLTLRAGIGGAPAYTPRQVASKLHLGQGREARIEHAALVQLVAAGRSGSCSNGVLIVPVQNELVSVSPALAGSSAVAVLASATPSPSGATGGGQASGAKRSSSGSSSSGKTIVESASLARPSASATIPALGIALAALALLAGFGLISPLGRRRAAAAAPEPVAPAPFPPEIVRTLAPPPQAVAPAVRSQPEPNSGWVRSHRSQVAIVATAVAGGVLRLVARSRRRS